jgi:hypothetical protein
MFNQVDINLLCLSEISLQNDHFCQDLFICDYEFNVDCENSPLRYSLNSNFGVTTTQRSNLLMSKRENDFANDNLEPKVQQEVVVDQLKESLDVEDMSLFGPTKK